MHNFLLSLVNSTLNRGAAQHTEKNTLIVSASLITDLLPKEYSAVSGGPEAEVGGPGTMPKSA